MRRAGRGGLARRQLQHVERAPGVAAGELRDGFQRAPSAFSVELAEAALRIGERAPQQRRPASSAASGSRRNTRPRDSSAAFTANDGFSVVAPIRMTVPLLDVRQQRVLLRLVEAVDLVDEEDRPAAVELLALLGARHELAQLRHAAHHRAERLEVAPWSRAATTLRERGLAGAGRAPEDHRRDAIRADGLREEARPAR